MCLVFRGRSARSALSGVLALLGGWLLAGAPAGAQGPEMPLPTEGTPVPCPRPQEPDEVVAGEVVLFREAAVRPDDDSAPAALAAFLQSVTKEDEGLFLHSLSAADRAALDQARQPSAEPADQAEEPGQPVDDCWMALHELLGESPTALDCQEEGDGAVAQVKTYGGDRVVLRLVKEEGHWKIRLPAAPAPEWLDPDGDYEPLPRASLKSENLPQWVGQLQNQEPKRRREAVVALGSFGPDGKEAIPALGKVLCLDRKPYLRAAAAQALAALGPAAAPVLVDGVRSWNPATRLYAFRALAALWAEEARHPSDHQAAGGDARELADLRARLVELAAGALKDRTLCYYALDFLHAAGPDAQAALKAVAERLREATGDEHFQDGACAVLAAMGPAAVPAILDLFDSPCPGTRIRAAGLFTQGGYEAQAGEVVPALVRMLRAGKDAPTREMAARALGAFGGLAAPAVPALADVLRDHASADGVLAAALDALGNIGPGARPAIPEVAGYFRDSRRATAEADTPLADKAGAALAAMGPEGMAVLLADLAARETATRLRAIQVLTLHSAAANAAAVGALAQALRDKEVVIRRAAAEALERIGVRAEEAVPALAEALRDPDAEVGVWVVATLAKLGPRAAPCLPVVLDGVRRKQLPVSDNLIDYLASLGAAAAPAVPWLIKDWETDDQAGPALRAIGPASVPALVAVVRGRREDRDVARAARLLGEMGPAAAAAVPALVEAYTNAHGPTAEALATALGHLGPKARAAIPALRRALGAPDEGPAPDGARLAAALALVRLGDVQTGAAALGRFIAQGKGHIAESAWAEHFETILAELDAGARVLGPAFQGLLRDPSLEVRLWAARALVKVNQPGGALPVLVEALRDQSSAEAARALGDMGPDAAQAVPALRAALQDREHPVHLAAAAALVRVARAGDALTVLMKAARDSEQDRDLAARELGAIGPAAREAVPALSEALNDESVRVRRTVREAIQKVAGS